MIEQQARAGALDNGVVLACDAGHVIHSVDSCTASIRPSVLVVGYIPASWDASAVYESTTTHHPRLTSC